MFPGYHKNINRHGLRALLKAPEIPHANLAIAGADEMSDVPLLIFRDQGTMPAVPVQEHIYNMSYEQTAVKGANDTVSMDDFATDNFTLGGAYDSVI